MTVSVFFYTNFDKKSCNLNKEIEGKITDVLSDILNKKENNKQNTNKKDIKLHI